MKIFSILKYFIIEAFVVYKCELCGDIYESNVYSAKKVYSEYSLIQIKNNLEEYGFVNQLEYFSI